MKNFKSIYHCMSIKFCCKVPWAKEQDFRQKTKLSFSLKSQGKEAQKKKTTSKQVSQRYKDYNLQTKAVTYTT